LVEVEKTVQLQRFVRRKLKEETTQGLGVFRDELFYSGQRIEDQVGQFVASVAAQLSQGCPGCEHVQALQSRCNGAYQEVLSSGCISLHRFADLRREGSILLRDKRSLTAQAHEILDELRYVSHPPSIILPRRGRSKPRSVESLSKTAGNLY
jgi:hypothetical protein